MLAFDGEVYDQPPKKQISTVVLQNCDKSAVKHFIEKPMLLNFLDLRTIFRPRLYL